MNLNKLPILFVILFSLLFTTNGFSSSQKIVSDTKSHLVVEVVSGYVLGDGDTQVDGRNIALQNAKKTAAEMAGSYVQSEQLIKDDEIKSDTLKTVSTALMSAKITKESVEITKDERIKVVLTVETKLDKKSFFGKLGILKNNSTKKKQLASLESENKNLKSELDELNKQIRALKSNQTAQVVKKPRKELVERRDVVLSKIEKNESSIRKVFEKGSLLSMAKKGSSDFDKAKEGIETNVLQHMKNNTKIIMSEPQFIETSNGAYNIEIVVQWSVDEKPILAELNKHFWSYSKRAIGFSQGRRDKGPKGIEISAHYNSKEDKKKPYSEKLYNYLKNKHAYIQLKTGKYSARIPIMKIDGEFFGCSGYCQLILPKSNFNTATKTRLGTNKVIIEDIPASVLETLTSIDASIAGNY